MRFSSTVCFVLAGLALAGTASAYTINYQISVDGVIAAKHDVNPGDVIEVGIWGICPDSESSGWYGGILQYSVNIQDSTGIVGVLDAEEKMGGPPMNPVPSGDWDSSSTSPFANYKGAVDSSGYDVYNQTGQVAPASWEDEWDTIGANVLDLLGWGNFIVDAGASAQEVTLTLVPGELAGMVLWNVPGWAAESATATSGDSTIINIVPEPATLGLLGLGLALVIRRKR